jgi:hypothetical protein
MSEKIVRHIPSATIIVDRYVKRRNNTRIEYKDKITKKDDECYIYKVSGSYSSSFNHTTSSYDPVTQSRGYSTKRLKELKDENKEKYFRNTDEIILEKTIIERPYGKECLIEASTNHGSSNHKYLKIWKYYWTDDDGWKPTKQGITIPIKDGKDLIKELYEILVRS